MKYYKEWRDFIDKFLRANLDHYKKNGVKDVLEIGYGGSTEIIFSFFPNLTIIDNWCHSTWKNVKIVDLCGKTPDDMISSFDLIVCCEVLEHCKYPWIAAKSITGMLRSNGILLLSVPSFLELHPHPKEYGDFYRFFPGYSKYLFSELKTIKEEKAEFGGILTGLTNVLIKC